MLHLAAKHGRSSFVKMLLDRGAPLEATDSFGKGPCSTLECHVAAQPRPDSAPLGGILLPSARHRTVGAQGRHSGCEGDGRQGDLGRDFDFALVRAKYKQTLGATLDFKAPKRG